MAHIAGLLELRTVPISEIRRFVADMRDGRVVGTEKIDGVHVAFTCGERFDVRFARDVASMRRGGEQLHVFAARFPDVGDLVGTVAAGCEAIRSAVVLNMSPSERSRIFASGTKWLSADVFARANENVVRYDRDSVYVHRVASTESTGFSWTVSDDTYTWEHTHGTMAVANAPALIVRGSKASDASFRVLDSLLADVESIAPTLESYLLALATEELDELRVRPAVLDLAAARLVGTSNAPRLDWLRDRIPYTASAKLRNSAEWNRRKLATLDRAIVSYTSRLLASFDTSLVADPSREAQRVERLFDVCASRARASRVAKAIAVAEASEDRLVDAVFASTEGFVVDRQELGGLVKVTGSYGPVNAVVGLCRHGRGRSVPPLGMP